MLHSCPHPSSSYTGFCWAEVNFLHGTSCGAVSQVCDQNQHWYHAISLFELRLNAVCTVQRTSVSHSALPVSRVWGAQEMDRETQPDRWLELSRDIPYHIVQLSAIERESKMEVRFRNQLSFCTRTGWTGGRWDQLHLHHLCCFPISFCYFFT